MDKEKLQWWHRSSLGPKTFTGRDLYCGDRKVAHNVKLEDAEYIVYAANWACTPSYFLPHADGELLE